MTGDNLTHLWLVSLNPHPATLSLLFSVTLIPAMLLGVSAHPKFVIPQFHLQLLFLTEAPTDFLGSSLPVCYLYPMGTGLLEISI